jgi:hypothetical protein
LIAQQQQLLEDQQETIAKLEKEVTKLQEKAASLDEQLLAAKKLKGKPKIRPSTLNQDKKKPKPEGKRPGSSKRSKKTDFFVDEQRIIEPEGLPERATFNRPLAKIGGRNCFSAPLILLIFMNLYEKIKFMKQE